MRTVGAYSVPQKVTQKWRGKEPRLQGRLGDLSLNIQGARLN